MYGKNIYFSAFISTDNCERLICSRLTTLFVFEEKCCGIKYGFMQNDTKKDMSMVYPTISG